MRAAFQHHRGLSRLALALVAIQALGFALGCQPPTSQAPSGDPAATVGDRTITIAALDERIKEDLFQNASGDGDPSKLYELRSETLDTLIEDALLEAAAEARSMSREDLMELEEAKAAPVTQAEMQTFYESVKDRLGDAAFDDVADQIRARFESQRRLEARAAYIGSLREASDVEVMIEPPRIEVAATGPSLGPDGAPVTIVEFSDYQCPFCQRAHPTLNAIAARYPDQVRIVYRHFPLDGIHPEARGAAEAAACADEQGRFWEYHELVFAATPELGAEKLEELAATAELDVDAFKACVAEGRFADLVANDLAEGQGAGVDGTPAFFVNGIPLSGAQPLEAFVKLIDAELERAGS
jgi:protein-disulfide isomerase